MDNMNKRRTIKKKPQIKREEVMFECFNRSNKQVEHLLQLIIKQGEVIMSTLVAVQANAVALTDAFNAEQARQATKNAAFQAAIDGANASLAAVQAELDALKAGGQTPENQAIIDDIDAKITAVTAGLNAAAV
jgi:hypothetical protein